MFKWISSNNDRHCSHSMTIKTVLLPALRRKRHSNKKCCIVVETVAVIDNAHHIHTHRSFGTQSTQCVWSWWKRTRALKNWKPWRAAAASVAAAMCCSTCAALTHFIICAWPPCASSVETTVAAMEGVTIPFSFDHKMKSMAVNPLLMLLKLTFTPCWSQ